MPGASTERVEYRLSARVCGTPHLWEWPDREDPAMNSGEFSDAFATLKPANQDVVGGCEQKIRFAVIGTQTTFTYVV